MKKLISLFMVLIFLSMPLEAFAGSSSEVNYYDEIGMLKSRATAYCLDGITASGKPVREGICAGKDEWFGKTIIVYQRLPGDKLGSLIGIYECLDKGGTEAIKNGWVIDIWEPDLEACQELMDKVYEDGCEGKIFIQVIDGVG